jgi:HEAT repeat protein
MRAMPVLRTAVASTGGTRDEAITALKYIWHPDEDTYRNDVPAQLRLLLSDRAAYKGAAAALAELGDVGAQALIRGSYAPDKKLRAAALSNLGLQRIQAGVDAALFNLEPLKASRKFDAITALGLIGDPSTAPAVIPFLIDPENRVAAVTSLGQIGDPVAVEPIIATLTETETEYRTATILALQRIGEPAFSSLVRELQSPQLEMRQGAAASLVGSSSPQVTEALINAIHDPDAKVRASAAMALGYPDNLRGVTPLLAALSDSDWHVVDAAVEALGAVGPNCIPQLLAAVADPDQTLTRRYQLARAVSAMGAPAVDQLVSYLSSPDLEVQKWSAVALGQIGGNTAVVELRRLQETATGDLQWVVREQLRQLHAIDS